MRRLGVAVGVALAFAPAAHAACGQRASVASGKAPLTVTFTATCASAAYTWDFGDGGTGTGQTVTHTFAAGGFRPTLTTDAGAETAKRITSISLRLTAPRLARHGKWIVLHATVVPRLPITLRGRHFVHGKLRVRVLAARPWVAKVGGVEATASTLVKPLLTVSLRGTPVVGSAVRVVPPYPASHGCSRIPMWIATTIYGLMPPGSTVYVYA